MGQAFAHFLLLDRISFWKHWLFPSSILSVKTVVLASGSVIFSKFWLVRETCIHLFHCVHLASSIFQVAGRFAWCSTLSFSVIMRGKWSLPMHGPVLIDADVEMVGEVMVRSIVHGLPDAGSMRVIWFGIVMRQALGSFIRSS